MSSLLLTTPDNGKPFATPLAKIMMSGRNEGRWEMEKYFPVRKKPVWTSSMMRTMLCLSHTSRRWCRNAGGQGTYPLSGSAEE